MVIKVCGIKTAENIQLMNQLKVDMVGLNFYPPSVRYISNEYPARMFDNLNPDIKRIGVFVNESIDKINEIAKTYKLDYIQLHGDEDLNYCKAIAENHKIIKVFRVNQDTKLNELDQYNFANYFLFDTATKDYGGSGLKFNWSKLNEYTGDVPFLLSGGIGPRDANSISELVHIQYIGIDINSKFESKPGIKDASLLKSFLHELLGD